MLQINGLQKHYGTFTLDLSMQVKKGQITGLIGQNGAGKSTAFKAVLGLIRSDAGTVTVLGKNCKDITPKDRELLGVVLSDSGFSAYLTVKDILPILSAMYQSFDKAYFMAGLSRFGLPQNKKLKEFSTGMKAKLKLLCALSHHAKLLLLDEPTAGLDVLAREELLDLLREYMEQNEDAAILISSHISSDLESLCDDIYMIHNGRVILHEDTDLLLGSYGILKLSHEQYQNIDQSYLIAVKKEEYGYLALTDQRQFYLDNHPSVILEKASIDNVIGIMMKGEKR